MKPFLQLLALSAILSSSIFLCGCSTAPVADTRMDGVERRQGRIDDRTYARQDRWAERGAREDARAAARFDSW